MAVCLCWSFTDEQAYDCIVFSWLLQAHQKDVLSGHTLGADVERNRKLKAALTRTNFR
jgi:hypothetical protein